MQVSQNSLAHVHLRLALRCRSASLPKRRSVRTRPRNPARMPRSHNHCRMPLCKASPYKAGLSTFQRPLQLSYHQL
jgi:hypothetical protein